MSICSSSVFCQKQIYSTPIGTVRMRMITIDQMKNISTHALIFYLHVTVLRVFAYLLSYIYTSSVIVTNVTTQI